MQERAAFAPPLGRNAIPVLAASCREHHGTETTVWDVATGQPIRELGGGYAWAVSPDGNSVAVGGSKFRLIDLKNERSNDFEGTEHAWASNAFLSPAVWQRV